MTQFLSENTWIVPIIVAIITALSGIVVAMINKKKDGNGRNQKVRNIKNSKVININGDVSIRTKGK